MIQLYAHRNGSHICVVGVYEYLFKQNKKDKMTFNTTDQTTTQAVAYISIVYITAHDFRNAMIECD